MTRPELSGPSDNGGSGATDVVRKIEVESLIYPGCQDGSLAVNNNNARASGAGDSRD